jgi:hypothetical protein
MVSTRASRSDEWSVPEFVTELNTVGDDVASIATPLSLYIARQNDIYHSTRPTPDAAWGAPVLLDDVSTSSVELQGHSPDDFIMYFSSDRPGGMGDHDLYITSRLGEDRWAPPQLQSELNSPGNDSDPWVSSDGRYIIFASDRGGRLDLWEATR